MNGIEKLHPKNHSLYVHVQKLLNLRWSYEAICDDIDLVGPNRVKELCEWFLAYKTPKRATMIRQSEPITWQEKPITNPKQMSAAFMAWKRQHEGVKATLKESGFEASAK